MIPREEPLLCAIDLPGYKGSNPFGFTPLDDSDYDAGACRWGWGWLGRSGHSAVETAAVVDAVPGAWPKPFTNAS